MTKPRITKQSPSATQAVSEVSRIAGFNLAKTSVPQLFVSSFEISSFVFQVLPTSYTKPGAIFSLNMRTIVDYSIVLERLTRPGFKSLYHNSGAFGFPADAVTVSRGWIGPDDPAIRESMRPIVRHVPPPFEQTMADLTVSLWQASLPGVVWLMPKSHWAYELEFGNREWLPEVLGKIGVDSSALLPLNNAAAIEFGVGETQQLRLFIGELLSKLTGSDFEMVFPGLQTLCTVHHRGQLWWTTADASVGDRLVELLP